ncbi:YwiC-like family protein [Actinomadura latina]|uniref:Uncharacterized protein n=1 Tax=Actinomadura latina TaxID=163603 RepID=A0A846YVF9_9ACTN|nr:YwiC-like family protein [Actinomadura latina]NKZ02488.1 hypothetical protein [Actinomadura latina]
MDVKISDSSPTVRFFHHGTGRGPRTGPMQNLTRYLCAAMYLDKGLCDAVIKEYVYVQHRAIVPSHGFDLEPVIRHARHARMMRLGRDAVLMALWLGLFLVVPFLAGVLLILCGLFAALHRFPWHRFPDPVRYLARVAAVGFSVALLWSTAPLLALMATVLKGFGFVLLLFVVVPILTGFPTAVVGHLYLVLRRLGRDLGPGAPGPGPDPGGTRFRRALEHVRASQDGNVTMYAGDNPFIGTGHPHSPDARVWAIALELDREASGLLDKPENAAPVDPVVMYERIRAKLHEMRDELPAAGGGRPLPPNERINGLVTGWHVTAHGRCVQRPRPVDEATGETRSGHPLIDPVGRVPYSMASEQAIDAAVRHPQAGIRCFQRVTIGVGGQAIITQDGVIAPAEDQEIGLSAFVHLAVEGRMLYGQFVATVLPPVRPAFKIVDELPGWDRMKLLGKAVVAALPGLFTAPLLAPSRHAAAVWRIARETFAAEVAPDPAAQLVQDYGARISVRELAADDGFRDFVQETDADKYTRLIERRVNEALLDYLGDECGIDVSAYRAQAGVIMNDGIIMTGGTVNGQVAAGRRVDQRQSGPGRTGRADHSTRINP